MGTGTAGEANVVEGWIDSHSHLQDSYLGTGRLLGDALQRARAAGVEQIVCVGTGPSTSGEALALAGQSSSGALGADAPRIWATVGLHPHDASEGTGATIRLIESAVAAGAGAPDGGRLVAVGECGLDYHYEHSPRDIQRQAFAEQIDAARHAGLALVIHARDAWDDLFDVLRAQGVPERTVLHCFTGGPEEVRRCLDAGMYVSFSGIVTFKNAQDVREAAAFCPLDRLLVETDSPFLAPVPHRGGANEPSYVPLVGAAVAALKGIEPAVVARASREATRAVFAL